MLKVLILSLTVAGLVALAGSGEGESEEIYTASTPCEEQSKLLLNIASTIDCEFMKWQLTLARNKATGESAHYRLHISYGMTKPNTNGFSGTPHEIQRTGKWTAELDPASRQAPIVLRLLSKDAEKELSFRRLNDRLLHLQDRDGRLMVGNGGWSYTLNRTEASSKGLAASGISSTFSVPRTGDQPPTIEKFVGRSPCREAARLINKPASPECIKIKWSFTFHRDPETGAPTTYKLRHTLIRDLIEKEGTWSLIKGTRTDPNATLYHVDADKPSESLFLQMVDENVLMILDRDMHPLVGNSDYSFTVNRAAL